MYAARQACSPPIITEGRPRQSSAAFPTNVGSWPRGRPPSALTEVKQKSVQPSMSRSGWAAGPGGWPQAGLAAPPGADVREAHWGLRM